MLTKVIFLVIFFGIMIAVGVISRKHATNVNDFVLGGRSVGPWLTAFAYGTSYFSAVVFVGYAGQFGYKYLDWYWKCDDRFIACMGNFRKKNPRYDQALICCNNA